jgi:RHS repeat-associated protein
MRMRIGRLFNVAAGTVREYIWLPETEIAPTREAMSQVDRPLAVVNGVGTAGVAIWNVSVDHLNRPVLMTNATKVAMWTAVWQPWGGAHSITGTATLDTRFPGQWYQSETGLHYNWHRSYDPTVGRYTQPDPLGFIDGPSVYGYAGGQPHAFVDPEGEAVFLVPIIGGVAGLALDYALDKYCSCDASPITSAAAGAAAADFTFPMIKETKRIGGSSPYLGRASEVFRTLTGGYKLPFRLPAPTVNNPAAMSRSLGTVLGRAAGPIGIGYLTYKVIKCLRK